MPRLPRSATHAPGALAHVICRFVDGRFVLDEEARREYLRLLSRALQPTDWALISYALMSSHVHLGFLMGHAELRSWILALHVRFAQWINRRLRPSNPKVLGHVFADRPTTKVMCPSRTRLLVAYHHRNPIEAGVGDDVAISTWTSHRAYLGLARIEGGLDVSLGLRLAGFDDSATGRREFHEFVSQTKIGPQELTPVTPELKPVRIARDARWVSPQVVIERTAAVMGEALAAVMRGSRRRPVVMVRRVALMVWLEWGFTAGEMGTALEISSSATSRLLSRAHDGDEVQTWARRVRAALSESE